MLPIVDKPTIQYIVEEAIESGIEDIIIVTGKTKRAIEDHFDSNFELEHSLKETGKHDLLEKVKEAEINVHYIRQHEPKGLGHAVWCARKFIGDEDRKSTRLNSSHVAISYAVFCLKKKKTETTTRKIKE